LSVAPAARRAASGEGEGGSDWLLLTCSLRGAKRIALAKSGGGFKQGVAWTIELVDNAADDFTACQIRLNEMLYKGLNHV
jgi:hypothetical protein